MEQVKLFDVLPDEIIQQTLFYLAPEDTLIFQHASRRLNGLANAPLLWRYYCRTSFVYWDAKHRIRHKFAGNASQIDWKKMYFHRRYVDQQTTRALDGILSGQTKRIEKFEEIGRFGFDAKDTLRRHCLAGEGFEDILARKYYAKAVLDHIHRSQALEEWYKLSQGDNVQLERVLGAFDLFVLHNEYGDLQDISDMFDSLAVQLRAENPGLDDRSPRERALTTVRFLRRHNLTGIASESRYRDLQNNYVGFALLHDKDHSSLPLISAAIFCAVAQRLSLKAFCCGFPNHVHAVIYLNEKEILDSSPLVEAVDMPYRMYLDPFSSEDEVSVEHLRTQLAAWGVKDEDYHRYMGDAGTRSMVLRTSRNILATVHDFDRDQSLSQPLIRLHGNSFADMDNALYSALWANFMLCKTSKRPDAAEGAQFLPLILERFERHFPMDASLLERYVCPAFENVDSTVRWELLETLRIVRAGDSMPKQIRRRDSTASMDHVKFQVGQIFRHKRYRYTAVIIGWDLECSMNSEWMVHNHINGLDRGRNQSFYHALVGDTSIFYVAEENIEIIQPDRPDSLMSLAGRYFKRWDIEKHRFISNVKDEYPDD